VGPVRLCWFAPDPDRIPASLLKRLDWRATECADDEFEFPKDARGYTPKSRPSEIWIRIGLQKLDLIVVIAHELKHLHEKAVEPARFEGDEFLREFDAYTFSAAGAEEFLRSSGEAKDSELQTVRNFGRCAMRILAIEAIKAGWTPEQFAERSSR